MNISLTGILIAAALLAPNLLFLAFPPRNVPEGAGSAGFVFTALERLGQIACLVLLALSQDPFAAADLPNLWFWLMAAAIVAYWCLWARYFARCRDFRWLFAPLGFVPIPMAVFPVAAFGLAAIWIKSPWLGLAAGALAVGHLTNSRHTYRQIK